MISTLLAMSDQSYNGIILLCLLAILGGTGAIGGPIRHDRYRRR